MKTSMQTKMPTKMKTTRPTIRPTFKQTKMLSLVAVAGFAALLSGCGTSNASALKSSPAATTVASAATTQAAVTGTGQGGGARPQNAPAAISAYRSCLVNNGIALPPLTTAGTAQTQTSAPVIDRNDPKVKAAIVTCAPLRPKGFGATGQGGHGGQGRGNFAAIRACLTKQGITLPSFTPGANGQRPVFDAKTQAAMTTCRQQVGSANPAAASVTTVANASSTTVGNG